MSNGEDADDGDAADAGEAEAPEDAEEPEDAVEGQAEETDDVVTVDSLDERLSAAGESLEAAETEADLDDVEATLDAIEADLEGADLPEPDEDDEDEDSPGEQLESRLSGLRDDLEEKRGPYAEDVVAKVEEAESTITGTRWTDDGGPAVVSAVEAFCDTAGEMLLDTFEADDGGPEAAAAALAEVRTAIEEADLDPDEDADAIATLLGAADELGEAIEDAEEWDDLLVREKLDHEGFYDVLTSENRKDYPPEWNAVKIYEKAYMAGDEEAIDMILMALDLQTSEFMQENVLESLWRIAPPEAFEELHQRAQKRNQLPIEILGKIGDERALETLHEFIEGSGNPPLQKTTLRAIGAIGSEESTEPVAQKLVADDDEVRSQAARTLGLIGDTRAIEPLSDVLADDEAREVRASAAWALNRIGTERAREIVAEYADDRDYLVQAEAEEAERAVASSG